MRRIARHSKLKRQTHIIRRARGVELCEIGKSCCSRLVPAGAQPRIFSPAIDRWISALKGLLIHSCEMGPRANCCSRTELNSRRQV